MPAVNPPGSDAPDRTTGAPSETGAEEVNTAGVACVAVNDAVASDGYQEIHWFWACPAAS